MNSTIPSGSVITQVVVYSTGSDVRMCHQFQLLGHTYPTLPICCIYCMLGSSSSYHHRQQQQQQQQHHDHHHHHCFGRPYIRCHRRCHSYYHDHRHHHHHQSHHPLSPWQAEAEYPWQAGPRILLCFMPEITDCHFSDAPAVSFEGACICFVICNT